MPMSSDQVAQMTASFQQQSMQGMQYSGMISQFAGQSDPQARASSLAGGGINTAAAIAGPLMSGAMMLKGWDPMSMAMSGAMRGYGAGGMMGAVGGGLMGAGLVAAPMMAASYAGGQMMQGMQEQQALGAQLGQGFRHMNSMGGRGFSRQESFAIGDQFRHMTDQRGPGGEFTTMDELGRLASNMGRMGMAQGVKNAKDFNEKFQTMMKSVKEIAESFSTSLEQAQQIMGSMRGSGVFGAEKQSMFAKGMRGAAVGGGVAMEEVSQAASIGSTLSRAVGGRGRAGAVAGVRAIATVGGALGAGVLSEEDVYNSTGLTGAAGRQAMATNMLQGDAEFFKSGRGRQLLASIAKKDGSIDMEAVQKIQSGETSVQDTIAMRGDHLNTMSRANFIRNEGRLRGEAMGAFGGMGKVHAYRGWIKGKGFDVDNMDDKAMLAFQRFAGVDRDEADNLIKMARNVESIQDSSKDRIKEDDIMRSVEERNKNVGIEGIKRKFEGAKQDVNNRLKQTGADILGSAENLVERFFNKVTGEYTRRIEKGMSESLRIAHRGGSADLGIGGLDAAAMQNIEKVYGAQIATPGKNDRGVPVGDVMALSERDRATALADYSMGGRGKAGGAMGAYLGASIGSMFGAAGGTAGFKIGAEVGDSLYGALGIGGGLSDGEKAKMGAYMESDDVLARNRRILGGKGKPGADDIKEMMAERDKVLKSDASEGEQEGALKNLALTMKLAGKSTKEIKDATGLDDEAISTLDQHKGMVGATLGAQTLRRVGQAADDYASFYKENASMSLADMDKGLYGGSRSDLQKKIEASKSPQEKARLQGSLAAGDKAHEFVGNYLLGMKGKHAELERLSGSTDKADIIKKAKLVEEMQADERKSRGGMEDMDEATLAKIAASGVEGLSEGASRELYEDDLIKKAKKSGRKGAGIQALAKMMGGDIDADTAKKLQGMSGDEQTAAFAEALGIKESDLGDTKDSLKEALGGLSKGDFKALDRGSAKLDDPKVRESIRKNERDRADKGAAETDPSYRKLDSMDKNLTKMLTVMGSINSETAKTAAALEKGKDEPT